MLTLAPVVQKSEELSGARRTRAEAVKPGRTPGKSICVARLAQPITVLLHQPWHKGSGLRWVIRGEAPRLSLLGDTTCNVRRSHHKESRCQSEQRPRKSEERQPIHSLQCLTTLARCLVNLCLLRTGSGLRP